MKLTSTMARLISAPDDDGGAAASGGAGASFAAGVSGDSTGDSGAGGEGGESSTGVVGAGTFYEGLDSDLFQDASLKPFIGEDGTIDGKNIIKSYIHAKRQVGANKLTIPGENATDDDWRQAFVSLGLPERNNYKLNQKDGSGITEDFLNKFHDSAHTAGILPKQAQHMLDMYADEMMAFEKTSSESATQQAEADFAGLQKDWGDAYDKKFLQAKKAFETFASPEQMKAIEDAGLGTNVTLQRIFQNIGESLNEDTFQGDSLPSGVMSPDEANREINSAMADPKGAYLNPSHPNHVQEVARVAKLYTMIG